MKDTRQMENLEIRCTNFNPVILDIYNGNNSLECRIHFAEVPLCCLKDFSSLSHTISLSLSLFFPPPALSVCVEICYMEALSLVVSRQEAGRIVSIGEDA